MSKLLIGIFSFVAYNLFFEKKNVGEQNEKKEPVKISREEIREIKDDENLVYTKNCTYKYYKKNE